MLSYLSDPNKTNVWFARSIRVLVGRSHSLSFCAIFGKYLKDYRGEFRLQKWRRPAAHACIDYY